MIQNYCESILTIVVTVFQNVAWLQTDKDTKLETQASANNTSTAVDGAIKVKVKVKKPIVLSEIHFRTTGRHLSVGSHSVICH